MRVALLCMNLLASPAFADPALVHLGRSLFSDPNLSATGTQSCASCHDPAAGFASTDPGGVVQGAIPGRFGNRKPPTVAYAYAAPPLHHMMDEGEVLFLGGAFHDGRATGNVTGSVLADQAMMPLLNPAEMALTDAAQVVARACASQPGLAVRDPAACTADTPDAAFALIARALAAYESSPEVNRFASRYDAGVLTAQEQAGLALFTTKAKCAPCHLTGPGPSGEPALFTDFTYDNLGVPRNPANPWYDQAANPDGAAWIDPGLALTLAADPVYASFAAAMLGKIKVPTLRNVDARPTPDATRAYMHNGYFKTLAGVVRFYNTRDLWPLCPTDLPEAQAMAQRCWPAAEVPATVNHDELGNLHLTPPEEAAVVAFLQTLTDD